MSSFQSRSSVDRRHVLLGAGAVGLVAAIGRSQVSTRAISGPQVSVTDFGAREDPRIDNSAAIQAAINAVERQGGGTVIVPGRYRCGNIVISGKGVRIQGVNGSLVDGRLTIQTRASNIEILDLGIVDTRGDQRTYLLDIGASACLFRNVQLVKDPPAGGYQMYVRQTAERCTFQGLRLKGSNGILVAGKHHLFENFDLEARMLKGVGGDDAFAIKGLEGATEDIVIRNGSVRGYAAIVSIGSEVGTQKPRGTPGSVRNVLVQDVTGEKCTSLAFIKPGALKTSWRNGLVEGVRLQGLTLNDPAGEYFRSGIMIWAGAGAQVRDITARAISISARARDRGIAPTAAIQVMLRNTGAPARIEDIDLQLSFADPYSGAPHSSAAPGFPIEYIAQIERGNGAGSMSGITLDVEGRGSARGGIYVGPGLDGAVRVARAILKRVATDPPSSRGGGGIWSDSRISLGAVDIDSVRLPKFGGRAFATARP